jgi:integrase
MWRLSIPATVSITGKQAKRWFDSRKQALAEVDRLRKHQQQVGSSAKLLDAGRIIEAADAWNLLDKAFQSQSQPAPPGTLRRIVQEEIKVMQQRAKSITLAERGALRLPTRGEFEQLVDKICTAGVSDCKAAADYVQFIAFSGARKTEAANVKWSDIDFNRETIHLRVTKNGKSRYVPMTREMRQLLERVKDQREKVAPEDRALLVKEA